MRNFNLFFLLLFFIVTAVYSQDQPPQPRVVFDDSLIEGRDYFVVYDTVGHVGPNTNSASDGSQEISVIVEFVDEPAARAQIQNNVSARSQVLSAKSQIQSRIEQLQGDLDRLSATLAPRQARKSSSTRINRSYHKVFSGAHVLMSESLEKDVRALPYVKNVYRDQEVKITLNESVSMINADKIWQDYGAYGEGIKVGIIDTGIDYNHPDLGGGFGEGYKVIDGYDFVNNDDDPMDDNSHGTHVAGIVAADGEAMKGVAPKATLFALKVLGVSGSGHGSDVIAAIEWSVDPNNDGDSSDKLDIVNMSLSGLGHSDDPMSMAVDNAVTMGVTYCIAAGNNIDYYTIGSPGTAREAITVGSVDKSGRISYFSSKGPTQKNFLTKPDIMAPGDGIQSTVPGGGYGYKNGTSMAAPHVAGAVALVLNLYPEWGPMEIKNAIMQTAKNIEGKSVFDQGKGIIDLKALTESESLVSPGSISLGLISSEEGIWTKTDTIIVKNQSNVLKSYEIEATYYQTQGVSFLFNRETLEVAPGEKGYFVYTATIDPGAVTASGFAPPDLGGEINIKNEAESHNIPYTFLSGNFLSLHFNTNPGIVIIHDQNGQRFQYVYPGKSLVRPFSPGIYDIIVSFGAGERIVLKENIEFDTSINLEIKDTEAIHEVLMLGLDIDGRETGVLEDGFWSLIHKKSNLGLKVSNIVILIGEPPKFSKRYLSDISDEYEFQSSLRSKPSWNDKKHFYNFPVFLDKGITRSLTYSNDPNEFVKSVYQFPYPQKNARLFYTKGLRAPGGLSLVDIYDSLSVLRYPYEIEEYLLPVPHENFVSNRYSSSKVYLLNTNSIEFDRNSDSLLMTSAYISLLPNSKKIGFWDSPSKYPRFNWMRITKELQDGYTKSKLLSGPTHYLRPFYMTGDGIQFYSQVRSFYDAFNSFSSGKITYVLKDEFDNTVGEGFVFNSPNYEISKFFPLIQDKRYRLDLRFTRNMVGNKISEAIVNYDFLFSSRDLPYINRLNTWASGNPTNLFLTNETIDITFAIANINALLSHKLYYQKEGQSTWKEVELEDTVVEGFGLPQKKGSITTSLEPGYYSLKITDEDSTLQLINQPAFLIESEYFFDSLALAEFYHSTKGDNWINNEGWLQSSNLADWHGVSVENGRVIAIDLSNNGLTGRVIESFNKLSALQRLILKNNKLEALMDLSKMDNLAYLDVSDNKLGFKDLLPNGFVENFIYAPQDSVGLKFEYHKSLGEHLELVVNDKSSDNKFVWIKDGNPIDLAPDSPKYVIDSLIYADKGKYHCQITNKLLPELRLYSKAQQVNISPEDFKPITHWGFLRGFHRTTGLNWVDYDGDKDQDLFLVGFNDYNKLMRNDVGSNGEIQFNETSIGGITGNIDFHIGSSWADYNNDGSIDSYVITSEPSSKNFLWRNDKGNFIIDENSPELNNHFKSSRSTSWGDYDNDGWVDLIVGNGWWNQLEDYKPKLFRNSASNIFTRSNIIDFSTGVEFSSWSDYDNDGDLDLFTASWRNQIWRNDGVEFKAIDLNPVNDFFGSKGASWGDYDNDGDMDLYITTSVLFGIGVERNAFFENHGNGELIHNENFEFTANVNNSHGSAWGDYDNDGDLDLFVANFYDKNELWQNQLVETGVLNFVQIKNGEIANAYSASTAAAWADYDRDGDLDLFVANYGEDNYFYENLQQGNNWINILCKGVVTNSSAIGAKVRLKAKINGKDYWQLREISTQTGFSAQNSLNVAFGLGDALIVDSLVIEWPTTGKQTLTNIEPNQFITVEEQPDLFLFPVEDIKIPQNNIFTVTLDVLHGTNENLIFSVNSDPEKIKSTIEGNSLRLESGLWIGTEIVEVSVTDGQRSHSISFKVEVYNDNLHLSIFPIEDLAMHQNEMTTIDLKVQYNGDQKLTFSVNSDPEKIKSTIEDNSLRLESGLWIGTEIVEVSVTDGQRSHSISFEVEVYNENLYLSIFPIEDLTIYQNEMTTIDLKVQYKGDQNLTFSVNSDPEKIKSTIEGNSLKLESGSWIGTETVEVSVTDGQGSHSISFEVEVVEEGTGTGGGEVITGFPQPKRELNVNLFPNPTNGYATLIVKQAESHNLHIEIFNSLGEKVFQKKEKNIATESSVQLPLNQFTPGVYIAKILVGNEFLTKKIIIR